MDIYIFKIDNEYVGSASSAIYTALTRIGYYIHSYKNWKEKTIEIQYITRLKGKSALSYTHRNDIATKEGLFPNRHWMKLIKTEAGKYEVRDRNG